jgi:hypothetical protein
MEEIISLITTMLLIIGTAGLLLNEFILGWGRTTTIVFAIFSVIGIALFLLSHWQNRSSNDTKSTH